MFRSTLSAKCAFLRLFEVTESDIQRVRPARSGAMIFHRTLFRCPACVKDFNAATPEEVDLQTSVFREGIPGLSSFGTPV
jgi:hypothetical protein